MKVTILVLFSSNHHFTDSKSTKFLLYLESKCLFWSWALRVSEEEFLTVKPKSSVSSLLISLLLALIHACLMPIQASQWSWFDGFTRSLAWNILSLRVKETATKLFFASFGLSRSSWLRVC